MEPQTSAASLLQRAKEVRQRLRNPPGGRQSSELDIVSEPVRRANIFAAIEAREVAERARRQKVIKDRWEKSAREWKAYALGNNGAGIRQRITVEAIVQACARHFGRAPKEIRSVYRDAALVRVRQIAMYLCRVLCVRNSFPQIGMEFGGRDHTTVLHGYNKIKNALPADAALYDDVMTIRSQFELDGCIEAGRIAVIQALSP